MDHMMILAGLISSFIVCISASDLGHYKVERAYDKGYHKDNGYDKDPKGYSEEPKGGRYYYGGKYNGKCGPDGLYYRDEYSFVLCSNAKGYVQPCAPGTRNTGYTNYEPGYYYGYSDFCDVNLVDYGYSAPKYGPGYANQPSFGFAAYRNSEQSGYGHDAPSRHSSSGYGYEDNRGYGKSSHRQDSYGGKQYGGYDSYSSGKDRYDPYPSYGKADSYQTRTVYGKDNSYKY